MACKWLFVKRFQCGNPTMPAIHGCMGKECEHWNNEGGGMETKYDPQSQYYCAGGIEVQDIIKAKLTPDQYIGWLMGNNIKYTCRMNFKGQNVRDAEKSANYSAWLCEAMKEQAK